MYEKAGRVLNSKTLVGLNALIAGIGLSLRSCHEGATSLLLPMCSGDNLSVPLSQASYAHCAGCFIAVFGLIGAAASVGLLATEKR